MPPRLHSHSGPSRVGRSVLAALLLGACTKGEADTAGDTSAELLADLEPGTGRLLVRFEMDDALWEQWPDGEVAVGPFWGSVYLADDVTGVGPVDGAESLESISAVVVDMRDGGGPTGVLITTGALPTGWVTILGFVDTDANADSEDPDPDNKDPVTVPSQNEFEVLERRESEAMVVFNLLNP
jgi:hypothetical protein